MFEYGTSKPMTISFFRVLQDSAPMRTSQVWIFVMTRILWRPVPMLDTSTCGNTVALAGNKFCLNSELEFVVSIIISESRPQEEDWQVLPRVHIGPTVRALTWGGGNKFLAINCVRQIFILTEQELAVDYYAGVSAFQTSPTNVIITNHGVKDDSNTDVTANAQVHDLKVTQNHLFLFGNGGKIMTFEQQKDINHVMPGGEFSLENVDLVTSDDQSIYTLEADRINVRSFQGTIKHTMSLNDDSGGLKLQTKGSYLMVVTKAGIVRIWDVSKRDMRAHCHPLNIKEKIGDFSRVQDVQMNCNATFLSVTLRPPQNSGIIDPKLYIYEIEKDTLRYFNFAAGQNDADDISVPPNSAQSHTIQDDSQVNLGSKFVTNKHVVNHLWDSDEVNFLACYTRCNNDQNQNNSSKSGEMMQPGKPALTSLFVHEDLGVVVHGSQLGMNA